MSKDYETQVLKLSIYLSDRYAELIDMQRDRKKFDGTAHSVESYYYKKVNRENAKKYATPS